MTKARLAILISGRGSNMAALATATINPHYPAQVVTVIADRPDAAGLTHAATAGLQTFVVARKKYRSQRSFEAALATALTAARPDWIALAGFMRILSPEFVTRWSGRIINIHPSLLPAYKGLDTHTRALSDGAKIHGATVHHVVPELDAGPIIAQAAIAVRPFDTHDTLAARVLAAEHALYPAALKTLIEGRAAAAGDTILFNPPLPA
ncbi:MAG: phosphoribosylglycinamide formyltransferase [Pseudomonadota bacterium]